MIGHVKFLVYFIITVKFIFYFLLILILLLACNAIL